MLYNLKKRFFPKYRTSSELILTPSQFVFLYEKNQKKIISSEIIPPTLGNSDFGKIKVLLDTSAYVNILDNGKDHLQNSLGIDLNELQYSMF